MKQHFSLPQSRPSDQRQTLHEQQVLLFWLLSKILRRLARSIHWTHLDAAEKCRLSATLALLESDVHLVRVILSPQPRGPLKPHSTLTSQATTKAASPKESTSGR